MRFAGNGGNPGIFFRPYIGLTSSVRRISNILKLKPREDIVAAFRGFMLRHHLQSWRTEIRAKSGKRAQSERTDMIRTKT